MVPGVEGAAQPLRPGEVPNAGPLKEDLNGRLDDVCISLSLLPALIEILLL